MEHLVVLLLILREYAPYMHWDQDGNPPMVELKSSYLVIIGILILRGFL